MSDEDAVDVRPAVSGASIIKGYAQNLPDTPGVYRMLDEHGNVLYVGKAKSLKKRVVSYSFFDRLSHRIQRMVAQTQSMEFIHTRTEVEAVLLESNLIKKLKPKYNILLRDDKSFPYIVLTGDHDFPLVKKHRGDKKQKGQYFGPFASAGDVHRTINTIQRVFMIRNCPDTVFENRSRPCLQYHIKRCTAPCVGYVTRESYGQQIQDTQDFLSGKSKDVQKRLAEDMQNASTNMDYERAAHLRDRIKALAAITASQDIHTNLDHADVIVAVRDQNQIGIQVFFFRAGRNNGNRAYFPRHHPEDRIDQVLGAFLAQFYENKPVPPHILVNTAPEDQRLLESVLTQKTGCKISIHVPKRGEKLNLIQFAERNAVAALKQKTLEQKNHIQDLKALGELFHRPDTPKRIEVYDNSHISGTNMVGGMIVMGPEGFDKKSYRKFNIQNAGRADDYAMMREVISRRFKGVKDGSLQPGAPDWPDIVIIDGGIGQFNAVQDIMREYGILDKLYLVAIAKGENRNAGRETLYSADYSALCLAHDDSRLHMLQRLRDEAHRFVLSAQRRRRHMDAETSPLDRIPGIGAKRKKALLTYFGSAKAALSASIEDLMKVEGISEALANDIKETL